MLELNRATGCEARTGREPRRADVTTWQMLLFGLQWQSSSSTRNHRSRYVDTLPAYMRPSHVFLPRTTAEGLQSNQTVPVARGPAPAITPALRGRASKQGARARGFGRLKKQPARSERVQSSLGTTRVPSLLKISCYLAESGGPALFRKEFMVSWRALGDMMSKRRRHTSLSRPHWLAARFAPVGL